MEDTGKKLPIEAVPHNDGTVVILGGTSGRVCKRSELAHYAFSGLKFYKPHFPNHCTFQREAPASASTSSKISRQIALARYPKTAKRAHLEQVMKELGKKNG